MRQSLHTHAQDSDTGCIPTHRYFSGGHRAGRGGGQDDKASHVCCRKHSKDQDRTDHPKTCYKPRKAKWNVHPLRGDWKKKKKRKKTKHRHHHRDPSPEDPTRIRVTVSQLGRAVWPTCSPTIACSSSQGLDSSSTSSVSCTRRHRKKQKLKAGHTHDDRDDSEMFWNFPETKKKLAEYTKKLRQPQVQIKVASSGAPCNRHFLCKKNILEFLNSLYPGSHSSGRLNFSRRTWSMFPSGYALPAGQQNRTQMEHVPRSKTGKRPTHEKQTVTESSESSRSEDSSFAQTHSSITELQKNFSVQTSERLCKHSTKVHQAAQTSLIVGGDPNIALCPKATQPSIQRITTIPSKVIAKGNKTTPNELGERKSHSPKRKKKHRKKTKRGCQKPSSSCCFSRGGENDRRFAGNFIASSSSSSTSTNASQSEFLRCLRHSRHKTKNPRSSSKRKRHVPRSEIRNFLAGLESVQDNCSDNCEDQRELMTLLAPSWTNKKPTPDDSLLLSCCFNHKNTCFAEFSTDPLQFQHKSSGKSNVKSGAENFPAPNQPGFLKKSVKGARETRIRCIPDFRRSRDPAENLQQQPFYGRTSRKTPTPQNELLSPSSQTIKKKQTKNAGISPWYLTIEDNLLGASDGSRHFSCSTELPSPKPKKKSRRLRTFSPSNLDSATTYQSHTQNILLYPSNDQKPDRKTRGGKYRKLTRNPSLRFTATTHRGRFRKRHSSKIKT